MDNTDRAKNVQKPCTHGLQNKKAMKSFDPQLPRQTFLRIGTRGLSKAALWLCLRRCAPPPCSSPFHRADKTKRKTSTQCVLVFLGAMEGTRTPGLLIRSKSLYPAELPTHTFRPEHDIFYHAGRFLSTVFCNYFYLFSKRTSFVRFCAVLFLWLVPTPAALAVFLQAISQFTEPLLPSPALRSLHDILRLRRLFRGKMRSKLLNWRFL